jgi:hypothetical protein
MRQGLDNLFRNAVPTMLFCPRIKTLEVLDHGNHVKFIRLDTVKIDARLSTTEFMIETKRQIKRKFIHISMKKYSDVLSKKYRVGRKMRLTLAVEVDDNEQVVAQRPETPSHFCDFPLIGSESQLMPVLINSPDFEPDSERESLILEGAEEDFLRHTISECGINRMILKETIHLFDVVVWFLSQSRVHGNMFHLLRGLQIVPTVRKSFEKEWFRKFVMIPYREVLKKYPIVETDNGNRKLFDGGRPHVIFIKDDDGEGTLYDLYRDYLDPARFAIKSQNTQWANHVWDECGLQGLTDLCTSIGLLKTTRRLELQPNSRYNKYEWLNELYRYIIKRNAITILRDIAIIPNHNEDFVSLKTEGIADGKMLTPFMIGVLKDLGEDLKPKLVHNEINALDTLLQVKIRVKELTERIDSRCKKLIKECELRHNVFDVTIDAVWPILRIVPDDPKYRAEFRDTQSNMFFFISSFRSKSEQPLVNNDIGISAWKHVHEWCRKALLTRFVEVGSIERLRLNNLSDRVGWLNRFYDFIQKDAREGELDNMAIVPDQDGIFQMRYKLSYDNIPAIFKTKVFEEYGIKFRSLLIYPGITTIRLSKTKGLKDVGEHIERIFTEIPTSYAASATIAALTRYARPGIMRPQIELDDSKRWRLSLLLLYILPFRESQNYKRNHSLLEFVANLFPQDVRSLTETVLEEELPRVWERPLCNCLKGVVYQIEQFRDLVTLSRRVVDCYDFLNNFYELLTMFGHYPKAAIYPNQRGTFCSFDALSSGINIPDELKDALFHLSGDKKTDIRTSLIDSRLKPPCEPKAESLKMICWEIDECIRVIYENPALHQNQIFRKYITYIHTAWVECRQDAESLFPHFYRQKGSIVCAIVLDKERRELLIQFGSMRPEDIQAIIAQEDKIGFLVGRCKSLEAEVKGLEEKKQQLTEDISGLEAKQIPQWNPVEVERRVTMHQSRVEDEISGCVRETFARVLPKHYDFSLLSSFIAESTDMDRNRETGYLGEAVVFKRMRDSGLFDQVSWPNRSERRTDESVTDANGEEFFITESFLPYDIVAVRRDGVRVYVEVKTTCHEMEGQRWPIHLSNAQLDLFGNGTGQDCGALALVFDPRRRRPTVRYFQIGPLPESAHF